MQVIKDSADISTYFVLRDSTTHAPKIDIVVTDIDLYYVAYRAAISAKADAAALGAANSTHADNSAYNIGGGLYRIDWPDIWTGDVGTKVQLKVVCAGVDDEFLEIEIVDPALAIAAAVRTNLTTELARLDAAITSRLAASGYTAPDNASISDIKAKTANLPSDPADQSAVEAAIITAVFAIESAITAAAPDVPTDDENAAAVWAYGARTLTGVTGSISYPVLSGSLRQDYITAISNLVAGDLPLGETEKIFAVNQAIRSYSRLRPRYCVEDEDGNGTIDYLLTLLEDWSDGFSVIKAIEYPLDDDEAAVNVLQDDAWQIYQKPTGKCLRFLDNTPSTSEDIRVAYTSVHVCTDDACTIPVIDEGAVQMLAAAGFCDMLATYYAQTSDSTIQADSVDHKSKASEYAARGRTYRKEYFDHMGIVPGSVAPASVTRDQDASSSHRGDQLTHPRKWR